eukprot:Hpha_TRINITY_DN17618_c0_g1::TRINITY_DN17618_c0_g1_i1::g.158755::m.158755
MVVSLRRQLRSGVVNVHAVLAEVLSFHAEDVALGSVATSPLVSCSVSSPPVSRAVQQKREQGRRTWMRNIFADVRNARDTRDLLNIVTLWERNGVVPTPALWTRVLREAAELI